MTPIPRLLIPRTKAEALLKNQIQRGKAMESGDLTLEGQTAAEKRLDEWEEQSRQMLLEMFDTPELADEFTRAAALYQRGQTWMDKLQYIGGRAVYKNYALEDILKRLDMYEEPATAKLQLTVTIEAAEKAITHFIDKGTDFYNYPTNGNALSQTEESFEAWTLKTAETLKHLFTTAEIAEGFIKITLQASPDNETEQARRVRIFYYNHQERLAYLKTLRETLALYATAKTVSTRTEPIDIVRLLCSRFHTVVRQLRNRHDNRETLKVDDEYDVQDLLHALLRIHFDDVRPEDPAPKQAGASSRTDFVLKKEQIVVEVKKTRATLKEKELGEQLIIDIERYRSHPDCKLLYCFVYDPEGYLSNPTGLENDLSRTEGGLTVQVQIAPKH